MNDKQMMNLLQEMGFRGVDLPLISKVRNPDYYGITWAPEARLALGARVRPRTGTQAERILEYSKRMDGITSLEATQVLNIMSFTKRISEFRQDPNYIVEQKWETNGRTKWLRFWIREVEDESPEVEGTV